MGFDSGLQMSEGWLYIEDFDRLFSVSTKDRKMSNGFELQKWKFRLDIRKNNVRVVKTWNSLPREVGGSPSLEVFPNMLVKYLAGMV